ncbi:maleylpyruvate isomerase family mycothiol-dependent enzyme [Actinoplanes sp. CA-252034]|uniref:maleylpyruvate isomerase family mycothiol-dependent enzyme n=1 Tax=Actinoplanes sp. CA-252034 TaxID=3239906 RepID=UPI003D985E4F
MNPWPEIHRQRLATADLLDGLRVDQWDQPSLCDGWTVRDVAGHLTLQQIGWRDLADMLRHWRGSMNANIQAAARRRAAAWTPQQLVSNIRDTAALRRRNIGVTPMETLIDLLVHAQDIAVPLGIDHATPPEAAAAATHRVLTMRFPPPLASARMMTGVRLTATDLTWSHGDGPEARGPIAALLLVTTGRAVALPRLTGPGAEVLRGRLSPRPPG